MAKKKNKNRANSQRMAEKRRAIAQKSVSVKTTDTKKSERKPKMSTRTMVTGALLTALVVILQFVGASIKLGPFSVSLVLIPIAIGAIICGKAVGTWLGFVFGVVVLASGDAAPFWAVNVLGTIITVLVKGMACGFVSGLVYELLIKIFSKKKNMTYVAAMIAALVCPIVNTGVFLLGCLVFFMDTVTQWAGGSNVGTYMIVVLVGINFIFEMAVNIIFAPAIGHVIKVVSKK